jgi:hypothetical protein
VRWSVLLCALCDLLFIRFFMESKSGNTFEQEHAEDAEGGAQGRASGQHRLPISFQVFALRRVAFFKEQRVAVCTSHLTGRRRLTARDPRFRDDDVVKVQPGTETTGIELTLPERPTDRSTAQRSGVSGF